MHSTLTLHTSPSPHTSSPFPCFLTHDRYGVMAYPMMTSLWIVGPMYYGCYSCRDRQYDAASRSSSYSVGAPQDRYEFEEAPFNTPSLDAAEWPLTLHLHNFTTFTPSGTVPLGKYFITLTTADGDTWETLETSLLTFGFVLLAIVLLCGCCHMSELCGYDDDLDVREIHEVHLADGTTISHDPYGTTVITHTTHQPPGCTPTYCYPGGPQVIPHHPSGGGMYGQQPGMQQVYPSAALPVAQPCGMASSSSSGLPTAVPAMGAVATAVPVHGDMPIAQGHHVKTKCI